MAQLRVISNPDGKVVPVGSAGAAAALELEVGCAETESSTASRPTNAVEDEWRIFSLLYGLFPPGVEDEEKAKRE